MRCLKVLILILIILLSLPFWLPKSGRQALSSYVFACYGSQVKQVGPNPGLIDGYVYKGSLSYKRTASFLTASVLWSSILE
jgi:hypothetical protein